MQLCKSACAWQGSPSKLHLGYVGWDLTAVKQGLWQAIEGVRLIARSGYLCHVCMHFVLHYVVSTFFYFEKTLVVARSGGSASQRVATFANINSMSAGAVALIQLTATVTDGNRGCLQAFNYSIFCLH